VFFYSPTANPVIYTLSLHDALPISTALDGADPFAARWIDAIAAVPKRKTKQRSTSLRLSLQGWLVVPQVIFIQSDQVIQISDHVVVLRIDLCHHVWFALKRLLRPGVIR